jgi:hypothetical protein
VVCILGAGCLDFGAFGGGVVQSGGGSAVSPFIFPLLSRKPPQSLNLSPKHFFAAILTLYIVAFVFCFWSLVAIVH